MAEGGISIPAIAGIAVGAALIILFAIFFTPAITNPDLQRAWISYEPTQCSSPPWISSWASLHQDQPFYKLAEEEQYQVIKNYYRDTGITVYDVKYRTSESPRCEACGCSAGYIIDFQVDDVDVNKLREDILKATVKIDQVVTVIIPERSSLRDSERNNFEPAIIKVVIGVNSTVRWSNQDITGHSIVADDKSDPDFYDATADDEGGAKELLNPSETFEFTFTKAGEFGYHSEPHPWMRGTVIVLPESEK